jgi:putative intracellular protease/amidase
MAAETILFILTNHGFLGDSGIPTGWYLPEVAHPYNILSKDFNIVIASPKGGQTPLDPDSVTMFKDDPESAAFLANPTSMKAMNESVPLSQIKSQDFVAVFYPGGHGPMFDLPHNAESHKLAREVYEAGGVVAAVCHGPAGLVNIKLSNGEYLVKGKQVTGFTNTEEDAVDKTKYMPFLLEDQFKGNGGIFSKAEDWAPHTHVDGRLITGQNPASASYVAEDILRVLKK